jgi:hypothetical protein
MDAKNFESTVLPDFYLKRGDAFASMKQLQKANAEYDRVSRGFPEYARYAFDQVNGKRVRKSQ